MKLQAMKIHLLSKLRFMFTDMRCGHNTSLTVHVWPILVRKLSNIVTCESYSYIS